MIRLFSTAIRALSHSPPAQAPGRTVTLNVQEMACDHCLKTVTKALETLPGVAKAVVSLEHKAAMVTYDDAKVDVASLIESITKAGYPCSLRS